MKTLLDKFVDAVFKTTESFMIETEDAYIGKQYYFFIQCSVGKARYIYGVHSYSCNFHTNLNLKPILKAIVTDHDVYIIDEFEFDIYLSYLKKDVLLPEHVYIITDILEKENEYVKSTIFPNYYNSLETIQITDNEIIKKCEDDARRNIFAKKSVDNEMKIDPMFGVQDIANSLCGIVNLETEALNRLLKNKEQWIARKSYYKKIKELMEDESIAENYEIQIAKGLRSVEAKMVTVHFEMNGIEAYAKISPDIIIAKMQNRDYFSYYDFETNKRGEELINKLGAAKWRGNKEKDVLTCKHIIKIIYGKKMLYTKEQ